MSISYTLTLYTIHSTLHCTSTVYCSWSIKGLKKLFHLSYVPATNLFQHILRHTHKCFTYNCNTVEKGENIQLFL